MERKEPADWVFFNVRFEDSKDEAIAIYKDEVIAIGSIPYIFSNYRGFKDFNAQGNAIINLKNKTIKVGEKAEGIVVYTNSPIENNIIWQMEEGKCVPMHEDLLDPHWDDH